MLDKKKNGLDKKKNVLDKKIKMSNAISMSYYFLDSILKSNTFYF